MRSKITLVMVAAAVVLTACFDEGGSKDTTDPGGNPPAAQNVAPTISGAPPANILEGEAYEFVPTASDADGDALEFAIARKPAWANFDAATGRLWGTPDTQDVGNFTNVAISVSDGQASASLANFDITVNGIALGVATISWNPPTENADGSTLNNLAGYRIYYGRDANTLSQSIVINNPGLTRYVVENLSPAKWYFRMTSVNSLGAESSRSPKVSKTIS